VTDVNAHRRSRTCPRARASRVAPYTFTATATDADVPAQTLTFSLVGAPSGATIDGLTGAFSWTPTEAQGPGSYPFSVRVSDGAHEHDAAITLHVTEVNAAPAIANVPASATIPELRPYTFTADRDRRRPAGADADVLARRRASGATIDGSTGAFSLDADRGAGPGSYPFSVRVSDGVANTDAAITLTVTDVELRAGDRERARERDASPSCRPTRSPPRHGQRRAGADADVLARRRARRRDDRRYDGRVQLDADRGAGPGSYPFTVRVSDGVANTDAAITLNVTEVNTAPAISGVPSSATIPRRSCTSSPLPPRTRTCPRRRCRSRSPVGRPAPRSIPVPVCSRGRRARAKGRGLIRSASA
jgi:hypothetical protein